MKDALAACTFAMDRAACSTAAHDRPAVTAALHDEQGNVLCQPAAAAAWAGIPACCVKRAIAARAPGDFAPGDVFHIGGGGLPDRWTGHATVLAPAFRGQRLVGFASTSLLARRRQAAAVSTPLRIYDTGNPCWDVIDDVGRRHAHVSTLVGTLPSMLAGCWTGVRALESLAERLGPEGRDPAWQAVHAESERRARAAIEQLPDGVYTARDSEGAAAEIRVAGAALTVSLRGGAGDPSCALPGATAGARAAYHELLLGGAVDDGSFRPLYVEFAVELGAAKPAAAAIAQLVLSGVAPVVRAPSATSTT